MNQNSSRACYANQFLCILTYAHHFLIMIKNESIFIILQIKGNYGLTEKYQLIKIRRNIILELLPVNGFYDKTKIPHV